MQNREINYRKTKGPIECERKNQSNTKSTLELIKKAVTGEVDCIFHTESVNYNFNICGIQEHIHGEVHSYVYEKIFWQQERAGGKNFFFSGSAMSTIV